MLANITRFGQLAAGLLTGKPSRDALAAERDALLAAGPPPAPRSMLEPSMPPSCSCESCTHAAAEEQRLRVTLAAWESRVRALDTQLVKLTWGDETERDAPGAALAALQAELLRAIDKIRMTPWERIIEHDGRGKPLRAWETAPQLAACLAQLNALYRHATIAMIYLPATELTASIEETRARMGAILMTPLRRPVDPEVAARAGTQVAEVNDAAKHGLVPMPGGNILEGTIRFAKKGRA